MPLHKLSHHLSYSLAALLLSFFPISLPAGVVVIEGDRAFKTPQRTGTLQLKSEREDFHLRFIEQKEGLLLHKDLVLVKRTQKNDEISLQAFDLSSGASLWYIEHIQEFDLAEEFLTLIALEEKGLKKMVYSIDISSGKILWQSYLKEAS